MSRSKPLISLRRPPSIAPVSTALAERFVGGDFPAAPDALEPMPAEAVAPVAAPAEPFPPPVLLRRHDDQDTNVHIEPASTSKTLPEPAAKVEARPEQAQPGSEAKRVGEGGPRRRGIVERAGGEQSRRMTFYLPPDLAKRFLIHCAEREVDMSDVAEGVIRAFLDSVSGEQNQMSAQLDRALNGAH